MGDLLPDQTSTITLRISILEKDVDMLKEQLRLYVPARENDLQLKGVQDTVSRIEQDVQEAKKKLADANNKLALQEAEVQKREAEQRESQAALQIKVLWGTVSTIITVLSSVLIGYITHLFR